MKTRGIAYWAFVNHLDKKYGQWKIMLEVSKEEAEKMKAVGLPVERVVTEDDRIVNQFQFSRYEMRRDGSGKKNKKPTCVDAATVPFDGLIGNGSEVIVRHKPYTWTFKGKEGMNSDLVGVQILNLIPYESEAKDDEDDDGGFEVMGKGIEGNEDNFKPENKKGADKEEEDNEY